jgi:cell division septal protein FtsQ
VLVAAVFAALSAADQVDQFLASDSAFVLPPGVRDAGAPGHLTLRGAVYASENRIRDVFAGDVGQSIYFIDLAARRQALLAIPWVEDASIARLWPNRLLVEIRERRPVAFLAPPPNAPARIVFIDRHGVLLPVPAKPEDLSLPILAGVSQRQTLEQRKLRVTQFLSVMQALGEWRDRVDEADLADPRNAQIVLQADKRAFLIRLGDRNFRTRIEHFLAYHGQILTEHPDACGFDLRSDGYIAVVERGANCVAR